ncbi:MAG: hypothetical protein U0R23_08005 [Candidatus Nanopelagicales bacterium]
MPRLSAHVLNLMREQCGVIAIWQLTAAQTRAATRASRLGHWQRLTRHTYLAGPARPNELQLAWAAVLHGGPSARLAGRTALVLHGWRHELTKPIHVVIPAHVTRTAAPEWLRIHRTQSVAGPAARPPRVAAHDACLQAAAWARTDREAMFIVVSALQQGLVEAGRLMARADGRRTRRSGLVRAVACEYRDGIQSLNERDFARLCRRYGVPRPVRQVRILDARGICRAIDVEFRYRGRRLRVEIEGIHHMNPANFLDDQDRHNSLVLNGEEPYLRFLSVAIHLDPEPTMRMILIGLGLDSGEQAI